MLWIGTAWESCVHEASPALPFRLTLRSDREEVDLNQARRSGCTSDLFSEGLPECVLSLLKTTLADCTRDAGTAGQSILSSQALSYLWCMDTYTVMSLARGEPQ